MHEDVHVLLTEASAWLHTPTCSYAIIVKGWPTQPKWGLGAMLLRRITPKQCTGSEKSVVLEEVPDFPEYHGPRGLWRFPKSNEGIRKAYGMEVAGRFYATKVEKIKNLVLDLEFLLEGLMDCPDEARGHREIVIDRKPTLDVHWRMF